MNNLFLYCFYLPVLFVRKIFLIIAEKINNCILYKVNCNQFEVFIKEKFSTKDKRFFIIIMPNVLHFLLASISLLPRNINICFIINGANRWEQKYLKQSFTYVPQFRLVSFLYTSFTHGRVLNLLFDTNISDFGIIDHDLFLFDKKFLDKLDFRPTDCLISLYSYENKKTKIQFPTTHFMYFNIRGIKNTIDKYKIGAQMYHKSPKRVRKIVTSFGFNRKHFPKEYLESFDTFHILMLSLYKEGYTFSKLNNCDAYHIGQTSYGAGSVVNSYINYRFLDAQKELLKNAKYKRLYFKHSGSKNLIKVMIRDNSMVNYILRINKLLTKVFGE